MSHQSTAAAHTLRNVVFLMTTAVGSVLLNVVLIAYIIADKFF